MSEWHGLTGAEIYLEIASSLANAKEAANKIDLVFEKDTEGNLKIKPSYLPSYVDDIIEGYIWKHKLDNKDVIGFYASCEGGKHADPIKGEKGIIYLDLHTNDTYRCNPDIIVEGIANQNNTSGNQFEFGTYIKITDAELEKRLDNFDTTNKPEGSIEKTIENISSDITNIEQSIDDLSSNIGSELDNIQTDVTDITDRFDGYCGQDKSIEQFLGVGNSLPTKDVGANCLYLLRSASGGNQMGLYMSKIDYSTGTPVLKWQRVGGLL